MKPVLIVHIPEYLPYGEHGESLPKHKAWDLFNTYVSSELGNDYHVLVFFAPPEQAGFRVECFNPGNIPPIAIEELKTRLKDQLELVGLSHKNPKYQQIEREEWPTKSHTHRE